MNKTLNLIKIAESVRKLAPEMKGVFSTSDLASIIAGGSALANARAMRRLVNNGVLTRVKKGIYVTQECDLWMLSGRLSKNSYVSMESALAFHGLIGTLTAGSLSVVHQARPGSIETPSGVIYFHMLAKNLFFGITRLAAGVNVADPEKAFIDLMYFHTKGARYSIDPLSEVAIHKLNKNKIMRYLRHYQNPKFVKFVKGFFNEK